MASPAILVETGAESKISAMSTGATPAGGNSLFVVVQGGVNFKVSDTQIAAGVSSNLNLQPGVLVESGSQAKTSAFPAGSTPSAGNTTFGVVQGGANTKITDTQVAAGVSAALNLQPSILMESGGQLKISGFSAAAALTGAELVAGVQAGGNVRITTAAIAALAGGGGGGASFNTGVKTGRFYSTPHLGTGFGGANTLGTIYLTCVYIPATMTVVSLSCEITAAGTTSVVEFGLYDTASGVPNNKVAGGVATVSTTTTGFKTAAVTPGVSVPAGWYWIAMLQTGSAAGSIRLVNNDFLLSAVMNATSVSGGINGSSVLGFTGGTGAAVLPASIAVATDFGNGILGVLGA